MSAGVERLVPSVGQALHLWWAVCYLVDDGAASALHPTMRRTHLIVESASVALDMAVAAESDRRRAEKASRYMGRVWTGTRWAPIYRNTVNERPS